MADTERFNFAITVENNEWVEKESNELGMSKAAFVNMCIARHREEKLAMKMMQDMGNISDIMSKMSKMLEESKGKNRE